jgi:U3 small nucleolar RNA-associated protein 15
MTDGTLSVRRRDPKASEVSAADAKRSALSTGAFEYFADFESAFASIGQPKTRKAGRKTEVVGPVDEFRVESVKRRKLKDYDKFLKTFQYGAALDAVMMKVRVKATHSFEGNWVSRLSSALRMLRTPALESPLPSYKSSYIEMVSG